ncbi:hypothetical protein BDN70DRAFT_931048 [Pholiota conissans]|uniref:Uncharacterized protein n=1 Tax=Pholiota conissans TaxID=109636 RepID=A0A9P5Z4I3_9AGAR|nr:hypothetical protein BDN70DRAFT_931048 [Pholiota conissans]
MRIFLLVVAWVLCEISGLSVLAARELFGVELTHVQAAYLTALDPPKFTRSTVAHFDIPLFGINDLPPTRRPRAPRPKHEHLEPLLSSSESESDADFSSTHHLRHSTKTSVPRRLLHPIPTSSLATLGNTPLTHPPSSMSNKIVPQFSGPLTANGLKQWLGACEDGFDNYQDTHEDKVLSVKTRIRLTGAALAEPQMAEWWSAGRKEYVELKLWESFVEKLKDRFMPIDWKTDALEMFYRCNQGKMDFRTFASTLAQTINALPSGTISSTIHKHHLLFHCNPHLYLRMRAVPGFSIDDSTQTPDKLISLMAAQWDSLVADNSSRVSRITPATPSTIPLTISPPSTTSYPKFVPPTEQEKAELSAAHGCWNCRGKPGDPDWIPHQRQNCPGNPTIGARPGRDFVPKTEPTPKKLVAAAALSTHPSDSTDSEADDYEFYLDNDSD